VVALSPNAGLQSFWAALRRLNQTDVRLEAVGELSARWAAEIGRALRTLVTTVAPGFLFLDDRRIEISLLALARLRIALTKNRQVLREDGLDGHDSRSFSELIASLASSDVRDAIIQATSGCAIRKTIAMPGGIRGSRLRRAVEYLLEVETPFRRDQVYWAFQLGPNRGGTRLVDLIVVPRSVADPHIGALRAHGIHLQEICYQEDTAPGAPVSLARFPRPREQARRRLLGSLGALIALQFIVIAALPIVDQSIEAAHFREETDRLSQIAGDLGGLQSNLEKAMVPIRQAQQELRAYPSASNVMRLLESELGPETTLDRFSLRGSTVQMTGATPDIAALTARLEKSSSVKPKSITRNGLSGATQQELFSVSLELTTAKEP
jgi:hypothetical protein